MKTIALMSYLMIISACATQKATSQTTSYLESAKLNFEAGQKAMQAQNYKEAITYFEKVREESAYSQYAALSDLSMGDAYYAQEEYLDAAYAYEFFIRFHPTHEKSAYALYQMIQSHYLGLPKGFFLAPPNYTKDQTQVKKIAQTCERFLNEFPHHEKQKEIQTIYTQMIEDLANHEYTIAEYYFQKKQYKGAIARYEAIIKEYPAFNKVQLCIMRLDQLNKK